jgi:uncharacterized protein YdeI (BOF family)
MKWIFLSLAGIVLFFILMAAPVQSGVPVAPTLQTQARPEPKSFTGTILKSGENYVLSDSATKSRYTLDDVKKAGLHEGKNVKVTGTLDKDSNVIQVKTIQDIV